MQGLGRLRLKPTRARHHPPVLLVLAFTRKDDTAVEPNNATNHPVGAERGPGRRKLRLGMGLASLGLIGGLIFFGVVGSQLVDSLMGVDEIVVGEDTGIELPEPGRYTVWFDADLEDVRPGDLALRRPGEEGLVPVAASALEGVGLNVDDESRVAWLDVTVEASGQYEVIVDDRLTGEVVFAPAMSNALLAALVLGGLIAGGLLLAGLVMAIVGASEQRRHRREGAPATSRPSAEREPLGGVRPRFAGGDPSLPPPPPGVAGSAVPGGTRPGIGSGGGPASDAPSTDTPSTDAPSTWSQPSRPPELSRGDERVGAEEPEWNAGPVPGPPSSDDSSSGARDRSSQDTDSSGWSKPSRKPRLPPGFGADGA